MEDTRITFETAKLAKEKGFNEMCESHFEDKGVAFDSYGTPFRPNDIQPHEILFARPTQSLLQKWLREIHNIKLCIHVSQEYVETWGKFYYKVCDIPIASKYYDNYEEALEIGLQEALKLINNG